MDCVITRTVDRIEISLAVEDAGSLCVALQPCGCRANKSHSTAKIRMQFQNGIKAAAFAQPGKVLRARGADEGAPV